MVPYFSLANFIILLFFMLREPPSKLWMGLALFVVFIVMYREQFWRIRYGPFFLSVQLIIVLLLAACYHPAYAYIGFIMSMPLSKQSTRFMVGVSVVFGIGILAVAIPRIDSSGPELLFILLPPLFGVCFMPWIIDRTIARYIQMAERLKAATEQLERMAQQEERQRIARELHDTLGHTLSLISLKGDLTAKLIPRAPDKAVAEAQDIRETARSALKQMRELVTEMRVVRLSEEYVHAKSLCAAASIQLEIEDSCYAGSNDAITDIERRSAASSAAMEHAPLSPLQETILAMCFREVLTNVVRHSHASQCTAALEITDGFVQLLVSDNGIGMEEKGIHRSDGNGIAGIKQRLMLVDGHLDIHSASDAGTQFIMNIPRIIRNDKVGEVK